MHTRVILAKGPALKPQCHFPRIYGGYPHEDEKGMIIESSSHVHGGYPLHDTSFLARNLFSPCIRGLSLRQGRRRNNHRIPCVYGGYPSTAYSDKDFLAPLRMRSYPAWASATLRIIVFPRLCGVIPTAKRAQIVIDSIFLVCTRVIRPFDDGFELKFYFPAYAGVILHDLLITKLSSQFSRLWEVIPVQRS